MKWFLILIFTVQILSQERAYKLEQYEAKLERGDTLIFTNIRKNYYLILALLLSAPSTAQIMISDKGYNPPADIFPPSIPSGLNGVAISDDSLLFYWTNPPETDFNRNVVWFMGAVKDSTSNDSIYIGGLTPNTTYGLRVLSVDNNGNRSAYSDSIQRITYDTTSSGATPPEMPTNLTVSDSTDDITLTWTNNPPNASNIVIMKNSADYDTVAYPIATWTESDTMDGVFRTYKIYAYNAGGESDTTSTVTTQRRSSNTYYFSSSGSDAGLGTVESPFKTTGKANSIWLNGLTAKFKVGETFNDAQLTVQSGAIYNSYGGNGRYIWQLPDLTTHDFVVNAFGKTNATIANAEIIGRLGVNVKNSSGLVFDNIDGHHYDNTNDIYMMENGIGWFYGDYSTLYIIIKNSIFELGFPQTGYANDMFNFLSSDYIYMENCYLKNNSHSLIELSAATHVLLRGIRFYNLYHHSFGTFAYMASDIVVDFNFIERTGSGIRGDNNPTQTTNGEVGANFQGRLANSIMRYNVFKQGGVSRDELNNAGNFKLVPPSYNNRIYNNVIDSTYSSVSLRMTFDDGDQYMYDNTLFNNAITRSGDPTWSSYYPGHPDVDSAVFIMWDQSSTYSPSGNVLEYNYFGSDGNNLYRFSPSASVYTTNTASISGFTFQNNLDGYRTTSVFDAPDDSVLNYTYWTPQTSRGNLYDSVLAKYNGKAPLIDAGRPHTYISGAVNNDTILVDDARVFFDGWNWLEGDSLLIDTFRVQVIGINYTTNYIALSGIVDVADNTPVYLINPYTHDAYKESAIDIGLE